VTVQRGGETQQQRRRATRQGAWRAADKPRVGYGAHACADRLRTLGFSVNGAAYVTMFMLARHASGTLPPAGADVARLYTGTLRAEYGGGAAGDSVAAASVAASSAAAATVKRDACRARAPQARGRRAAAQSASACGER
jgi:hypothetical protein